MAWLGTELTHMEAMLAMLYARDDPIPMFTESTYVKLNPFAVP
jgi:hypothetical protein